MASNKPWAFEPAIAFLESDSTVVVSSDIPPLVEPLKTDIRYASESDSTDGGVALGSFDRVYRHLGVAKVAPPDHDVHDERDDSAGSTLVTSPPPLTLDASDGDVDKDASSGSELASGLVALYADVEVSESAAAVVAVGKHHRTNKKKKEKKRRKALAAQEKAVEVQTILDSQNVSQKEAGLGGERKQQRPVGSFEPATYNLAARKPMDDVTSSGKGGQQPTANTGQAVRTADQPLVSNPLQFLSKGRFKEKKSAATVAVAPPIVDNITPALASYVQRTDRSAAGPVTDDPIKPGVPGPTDMKATQKRSRKVEEHPRPPKPIADPHHGLSAAQPSAPTVEHHMQQSSNQAVRTHPFAFQHQQTQQVLQEQQLLPAGTGFTYLAPGQQVRYNPLFSTAPSPQQPSALPYFLLPNVHVPHLNPLANAGPAGTQPVISASQTAAPTNTQKRRAVPPIRIGKRLRFLEKLVHEFPDDAEHLVAPMRLKTHDDPNNPQGIHVFIDASNILIGFRDFMRQKGIKYPELCISSFFLLLERKRPVAKRVYVGSRRSDAPMLSHEKHMELASAVGYETNIYERVRKTKEKTEKQMFHDDAEKFGYNVANRMQEQRREAQKNANAVAPSSFAQFQYPSNTGYPLNTTGSSFPGPGNPEMGTPPPSPPLAPKWVEQGVDELIQLKIMHSLYDTAKPSTIVLATGDGAEAEFSDGFFAHVLRALKGGWRVELVAWRKQINCEYRKREFQEFWGERFRILELDAWWEGLVEG